MDSGTAVRGHDRPTPPSDPPVAYFTQAASFDRMWPVVQRHMRDVLDRGVYSDSAKSRELEGRIRELTGARYALAVGNPTDGLVLLLKAAGIGPGHEVVVPALAPVHAASAVAQTGARVVFADIDPDTYGLDPASLRAAITPRTRAIVPARQFSGPLPGGAGDAEVFGIAEAYGLRVFEDAGDAWGAARPGSGAGPSGEDAAAVPAGWGGVLSFDPAGVLGALGDAAMVVTDDPALAGTVTALRNHGRRPGSKPLPTGLAEVAEQGELLGTNAKMDDLQAAVVLARLTTLGPAAAHRDELARAYGERLAGLPGLLGLPAARVDASPGVPAPSRYLVEAEDRDALAAHLAAHGIGTETPVRRPLHLQPAFAPSARRAGDLPAAERAARHLLALPLHPDLTLDEVGRVCAAVRSFYAGDKTP
ncbi:DegT/DnrJ/EryC1/StrS family aminotransferase [Streptomyces sp. ISL-43]|uniref:DegT/DnrJ/EryC1/StrS family aminotransferase n=1 Tax=Streptomyces sp. ISL-43 TaxID=2819183 RepID=UPI001BEB5A5C|nr:DegT/DnrJ/EryC1/StrS family aminotransferase [Streptomyces sp. ISL-43]MBT2446397.1 DegT/DnrJ/EryC1/StrS family aminotransferase [Streptomyces sp. ISL-43]